MSAPKTLLIVYHSLTGGTLQMAEAARAGAALGGGVVVRLLHAAHAAPSVGLMQPWRFIRITDEALRKRIHALVDEAAEILFGPDGRGMEPER